MMADAPTFLQRRGIDLLLGGTSAAGVRSAGVMLEGPMTPFLKREFSPQAWRERGPSSCALPWGGPAACVRAAIRIVSPSRRSIQYVW